MLDGLRGETSITELCRREGIAESTYYSWPASAGSTRRGRSCPGPTPLRSHSKTRPENSAYLAPYYSHTDRPSIDPVLMIRMSIVGYMFAIRSERRSCSEVQVNLA